MKSVLAWFPLISALVIGCGLLAGCADEPAPSVGHVHGEPIAAVERPSDEDCQRRLRAERQVAKRVRAELAVDGIAATDAAIEAAAADPTADTQILGIPLTADELVALKASGYGMDGASALAFWVNAGASDRFGGIWIDPPGSSHYVVAVVGGDPQTVATARCLEGVDVRYVWAVTSLADGEAIKDRVGTDMQALRAMGIELNTIDYDELRGIVEVGVTHITPGLEQQFVERYGPLIRLVEQGPVVPL